MRSDEFRSTLMNRLGATTVITEGIFNFEFLNYDFLSKKVTLLEHLFDICLPRKERSDCTG